MIGPRVGLRVGPKVGLAIGVGADQIGSSTSASTTTMTASLADSADPTPAGANFDYTLVVTNTGSISATSVSAAITLDASLAFVSASGSGWTCNAVGQVVTCTRATMAVGAAPTVTVTVTAGNSDVTASTSVAVTAANASEADDTETTGVVRPTMTASLADSADPTPAGANFNITFDLTNNGTGTINNASATVTLDAGLTWVSTSGGAGWTVGHSGQNVTATKASFAAGAMPTITITVTAGNTTASASTSVSVTATNAATATDTETTSVVRPVMVATLNDSADPVINGKNFNITVDLVNNGTGTINNPSGILVLDSNLTWVSTSGGAGWTVGHSGQNVTFTIASLAQAGTLPTITVTVTAAQASTATASSVVTVTADNAANATDTETTQLNFIARDATSSVYVPASATEWTNFIAYNGLSIAVPVSLWLCQEASGNLADSIGSVTLTKAGSPSFQQTITGWTRKAVKCAEGATDGFQAAAGVGINPSTTSVCMLALVDVTSIPVANRNIISVGGAVAGTEFCLEATSASHPRIKLLASTANGTSDMVATGVEACAIKYDRTGATAKVFTSGEKITAGTYSALVTDGLKGLGATLAASTVAGYLYACAWSGTNGEMSDATLKAALVAMGFSIAWS